MSFPWTVAMNAGEEKDRYTEDSRPQIFPGSYGQTPDGRMFRFVKCGGVAIGAGKLVAIEAAVADHDFRSVASAASANDTSVTITVGGSTEFTVDEYADGYLNIENDTASSGAATTVGEGYLYKIKSHPAAATSASLVVTLAPGHHLRAPLTTTTTVGFVRNPGRDVVIHPSIPLSPVIGVTQRALEVNTSSSNYSWGWVCVKGYTSVLADGTLIIGQGVRPSEDDDGAVAHQDYSESAASDTGTVGRCVYIAADTTHAVIDLSL